MRALVEFLDDKMVAEDRIEDCDILSTEASQVRLTWGDQEVNILNAKIILGTDHIFILGTGDKEGKIKKYYLRVKLQMS
jgi:hypothetical protein